LLAQAEEGLLLLISCLPNTNGAINRGIYHTAVLWMATHTCDLQEKKPQKLQNKVMANSMQ
jgi:hypothetical protein